MDRTLDPLAERFEAHRTRLRQVAQRILGSSSEAEDAVQEAWLRYSRADTSDVENLGGWLTTVVSRICFTMLQTRNRRGGPVDVTEMELPQSDSTLDPEEEAALADTVGIALTIVLDTLSPAERVAFVLHDLFGVSFEEIAPIVGRSGEATRQLASRARRRVRGHEPDAGQNGSRQAELVAAFIAAARMGDFAALLALLDPDIELRADEHAVSMGAAPLTHGAHDVAMFLRRARGARQALIDGLPGAVWMPGDELRVVYRFSVVGDAITGVDLVADPQRLAQLVLEDVEPEWGFTSKPG